MIQSDKFDSFNMDIKKITNSILLFIAKRLTETFGLLILIFGILLSVSLLSYSPEDPNFVFPENTDIKNILGFRGSYISDLFFQSIGLISYLFCLTLIFTGLNITLSKDLFLIIENIFYSILYLVLGSSFFNHFYDSAFVLFINGNGGFVGGYINENLLSTLITLNENVSYYFLIILIIGLFLLSINFNVRKFFNFLKKISSLFLKRKQNYTDKSEVISEYIPQDEIKNLIQEDLPFIKADEIKKTEKLRFKMPDLELLKTPLKKERESSSKNQSSNPEFLEKILSDFGVNGKIKKVSHGPVVTLNEFEPAAGVKVSKIINLSDDIARNTSSESARISTIPGSNTLGIELPNSSRENVFLSEILNSPDFKKKEIK